MESTVEDDGSAAKEVGETLIDLLVDLDILCKKLEVLGEETLIFCSGSDGVITSNLAALFFKPIDIVFSKFKEFCTKQKPLEDEHVVVETSLAKEDEVEPIEDDYDGDTDDEYVEVKELEIKVEKELCVDKDDNDAEGNVDKETIEEIPSKRYLENGKQDGIQKVKLDGTDFYTEIKSLMPNISLNQVDGKKSAGTQSNREKKYLEVNNEKLLLITPEETGVDFTKEENKAMNCFKCKKVAGSLSRFREHLTKVHKIKVGHQCVCGRFFQDTISYNKHVDNKWYKMYHHECQECKGIYPSVASLKSHIMRIHDGKAEELILNQAEKLGDFPCLKCETLFHHEQHLIDHAENLPDCDVTVKDDKKAEKELNDMEVVYMIEDGKEEKTTYGNIMAGEKEPPHICPCCNDSFTRRSNLQRHLLRHLTQGTHLCLICGNKFKGKDGLQRHLNQHMSKPYNCTSCRNRFASQTELAIHVASRCKEGNREDFKCDLCQHTASNMSALQTHKNMHAGLKPFDCTKCGKSFATKSSLERHDIVRHQDATPFQCALCGKAFKTKDNLKKHMKVHQAPKFACEYGDVDDPERENIINDLALVCGKGWVDMPGLKKHMQVHTKAKPFICELCGKACTEKGNLNKHMRTHTQEKPFICELCGKAYGRKSLLENHRRLHTGEKPYKCTKEGCDKAFRSYSNLKQHMRNHSATHPYVCDICGKRFKQPGRLNHHRKDHTIDWRWPCSYCEQKFRSIFMYKGHLAKFHPDMKNDIEQKTNIRLYECEMCHKMYGDKDDLTRHIYIHKNLKPFNCQYCGKSFNDKSNMRQHEKIHTGVKHHFCEVCKKGFIHRRDLRNHLLTNHTKDEDGDVKPVRARRQKRETSYMTNRMAAQGFTGLSSMEGHVQDHGLDMSLIPADYQVQESKAVETVIEEQPRDLTMQPALHYLGQSGEIPIQNFIQPVAAVNAATGQIESLMIIENYQ